ncbi:MAG: acetylxylan esterase [Draconibacterium sp.]|nr:acetylxylan esterase [Draconibacterium sp.]
MKRTITFSILFLFVIQLFAQEPSKSVFYSAGNNQTWILYKNNNQALYKIITNEAFTLLEQREQHIKNLSTKADWTNYQNELKSKFDASLVKFQKTPLNAKVTGKLERENFTVEKIIFESHPGFYVTAAMFIPKKLTKPAPAVIYCSGHTDLGFRSEVYQRVMINLVEKGFVVLAFDPIGQGERLQYVDAETGKSKVEGPTTEHSYAGVQTLLTGTSLSDYFIWDGVRAIDYLETRPEVDMNRIGITGRSGGGTQSALIAAYDERIYAAAPECYITSFKRLLQSIGPQDAEQNPYNFIKKGMDHADFLHIRAPKPALIITTTHDFFSQQGARETFAEVQKSYLAFGQPENIQFTEDFGKHESTKNNRETLYAFFQKQLKLPGNSNDLEITPFKYEELLCTPSGQLGTSLKGETVFSLNQKYFKKIEISQDELKQKIAELSGIDFNRNLTAAVFTGKMDKKDFEVKKYFLENDKKDYALPVFVISKLGSVQIKNLIWVSQNGKEEVLKSDLLSEFLNNGFTIISADLPGIGELSDSSFRGDGIVQNVPFNYTFGANLVGKSIPGIQAEALDLLVQFVQKQFPDNKIEIISGENMESTVLHFAALKNPFAKIVLLNPLQTNIGLVKTEYYDPKPAFNMVPGSFPFYDFNDLVKTLPSNSVKIFTPEKGAEIFKYLNLN